MNENRTEIERKFLVKGDSFKKEATQAVRIIQGYISSGNGRTVRVRTWNDKGYLTIKGSSRPGGLSRFEWEIEIPYDDAIALLDLHVGIVIDKTRYLVPNTDGVHTWEVDEFHGDNAPLVMAEVEMKTEEDSFDVPSWIGREVTGDGRFYNGHLSREPFKSWMEHMDEDPEEPEDSSATQNA